MITALRLVNYGVQPRSSSRIFDLIGSSYCRSDSGAKNQWNELVTLSIQPQSNPNRKV